MTKATATSTEWLVESLVFPVTLALLAALSSPASGKPPELSAWSPTGVARGSEAEISAEGSFDNWPVQAWVDRPGLKLEPLEKKGQFRAVADPDVQPGVYRVRLYDGEGASDVRPLLVGMLPEVREDERNNAPDQAQRIDAAVTVSGKLSRRGDVDTYAVSLTQGQTLVASVLANNTLASPMDAVLQVCLADGLVLEQNDDERGLDPQIVFPVPADGTYLVRIFAFPKEPNSTIGFAGGDDYRYRLTVTAAGFVDYCLPLAAPEGESFTAVLVGWNLPEADRQQNLAADPDARWRTVFHPACAGSTRLPIAPGAPWVAPGDCSPQKPLRVELPATISGQLESPGDVDAVTWTASKDQKFAIQVDSRELGFRTDPVLRIVDQQGKQLSEVDDVRRGGPDSRTTFTAPADGEFQAEVSDVYGFGGERHAYRLSIAELQPSFSLEVEDDSFVLERGEDKKLEITVKVERENGFAEPIEIGVQSLPEGVQALPVTSQPKGDSSKEVKLQLTAAADAKPLSVPIVIVGKAGDRQAAAAAQAAGLPLEQLWLTVK